MPSRPISPTAKERQIAKFDPLFLAEIQRASFLPHRQLFAKDLDQTLARHIVPENTNIYFFTRTPKLRFHRELNSVDFLGNLKLTVVVGNNPASTVAVRTTVFELLPSLSELLPPGYRAVSSPIDRFWIDRDWSDESTLYIATAFRDGRTTGFPIPLEALFKIDLQLGNDPEVVYIGQSRQILTRLRIHKKLNQAASELRDDQELRIHFLLFKFGVGGVRPFGEEWNALLARPDKRDEYRDKILLLERALIAFFRPRYNDQHVHADLAKDRQVRMVLRRRAIRTIVLGLGMAGHNWRYWSPRQSSDAEIVSFRFDEPEKGFMKGVGPALGVNAGLED